MRQLVEAAGCPSAPPPSQHRAPPAVHAPRGHTAPAYTIAVLMRHGLVTRGYSGWVGARFRAALIQMFSRRRWAVGGGGRRTATKPVGVVK